MRRYQNSKVDFAINSFPITALILALIITLWLHPRFVYIGRTKLFTHDFEQLQARLKSDDTGALEEWWQDRDWLGFGYFVQQSLEAYPGSKVDELETTYILGDHQFVDRAVKPSEVRLLNLQPNQYLFSPKQAQAQNGFYFENGNLQGYSWLMTIAQ